MPDKILQRALHLRQAGFSVVPVFCNGSKEAAVQWKSYQRHRCDQVEIQRWYGGAERYGIGLVCGRVSGNLEVIDFDDATMIEPFEQLVPAELFCKLTIVETGSGKRHYAYRRDSAPGGRRILAYQALQPGQKKPQVGIELRGEGCMTITAGSPASVHPLGRPYRRIGGPRFSKMAVLTRAECKILRRICRSLTKWVDDRSSRRTKCMKRASPVEISRPGDHFNEAGTWDEVLAPASFELVHEDDSGQYWRRPGGTSDWSVHTGLRSRNGRDLMYVFSTNTGYFEADRCYDKFSAFAAIHHNDNLSRAAADLRRKGYGVEEETDEGQSGVVLKLESFASIKPETVGWVWQDRIPLGKMTILSGDAGLGKSFLCCDMASRVSTGRRFPDGASCARGEFAILSCEDDKADTIRPRLDAHGANTTRVHNISVTTADGDYAQLDLGAHMDLLRRLMERHPAIRVIVLDPITAFMGKIDQNSVTDIRRIFGPLADFCQEYQVAVVGISHLTKREGRAVSMTLGSGAFIQAVRSNWMVFPDPEDRERRLFLEGKNNLARANGLAFRIRDGRLRWYRHPVYIDANDVSRQLKTSAKDRAIAFLKKILGDGPLAANEVLKRRRWYGVSERTLMRAKSALEVVTEKDRDHWVWRLPDDQDRAAGTESKDATR